MRIATALCLLVLGATSAAGETPTVHFSGYLRETGSFDYSALGDTLWFAAHITSIDGAAGLPYDPQANEYTLVVRELISMGEITDSGVTDIHHRDGRLEIYADPSFNSDYMDLPIGDQPPASFCDGELWLAGSLADLHFQLWRDFQMGVYEGVTVFSGGSALPYFPEGMTFGGTLVPLPPTFVEIGYGAACDGELWLEATGTRADSFGAIKALY